MRVESSSRRRARAWIWVVVVVAAAAAVGSRAEVVDRIVATVDGEPVTLVELESFAEQVRRRGGAEASLDQRALLDELVLEKIIKKKVESLGVGAAEEQIDSYIESIRGKNNLTEEQLRAVLDQQGMTWEQYRAQVKADFERANLINREIRSKVNISPEEIDRYYKAHPEEFGGGGGTRLRVRLISRTVPDGAPPEVRADARAEAERIQKEAADGKSFAELAKAHSQGPAATEGGDLGEIAPGDMQEEFARALKGLDPGDVSPVVETKSGYHILKVEGRAVKSDKPSPEVAETIREKLYRETMEERYDRWLKQDLRAQYHVEILL